MRRPGLILAGVLLATGSSLALAAPASATDSAPDHRRHCWYSSNGNWYPWHNDWYDNWNDDWNGGDGHHWSARTAGSDTHRRHCYRHRHHGGGIVIIGGGHRR
ncbi:hypothetical protein GCM10020358_41970 [Amorphoplanes nipponensis]|uniref:Secreted protein n=1 Tax=Actinoplanes nipponensis TaxID=135950 RepID=A0A919MMN7_9ACTN|nr:hypothetical protein [Actinoplanes nipponensis]GIE47613.1 hypothetical protein Ani05nite_11470 [Actinoplanes nipponensis]